MPNINEALDLDVLSAKNSPIHNLDGRIKLIVFIGVILFSVLSSQLFSQIVIEIFLLCIMYIATLSFKSSFSRILLLLPFGGAIIIFQPFIHPGNIIWSSGISWINITDTGLNWAVILLSRLIVCLTSVVILSSTSPMQEIVDSFRKLGMPQSLAMILSITIRFLFLFIEELSQIRNAQKSRNFHIHSKLTPYKWRVKQVGYTIAMMFIRSYKKGDAVYASMASRGFSEDSEFYMSRKKITKSDGLFLLSLIILICIIEIILIFFTPNLGYFGINLLS